MTDIPFGPTRVPPPPATRRQDLVEELHGVQVADPFRWLEEGNDPDVSAWVEAQNAYTRSLLDQVPSLDKIRGRILELLSLTVSGPPVPRKGRYFFTRRTPEQNQADLFVRQGLEGEDRRLVDVNGLSEDGTVSLDWWFPSRDGHFLAYGVSESGSENSTLHLFDVDEGAVIEVIPNTRHCSLAWLPDSTGFYYTRHPEKGEVAEGDEVYYARIYFHERGSDWHTDPLVFGEGREKTELPSVVLSPDGATLVVNAFKGSADVSDVYVRHPAHEGSFATVIEGEGAISFARPVGGWVYLTTNLDAPNYRVFRFKPDAPGRQAWDEVLAETDQKLEGITLVGGKLFAQYLENVTSRIRVFEADGSGGADVDLPGLGSTGAFTGEWDGNEAFLTFTSFHIPLTVYRYDLESNDLSVFTRTEVDVDMDGFEISQVWATSKDGTRVPMFVGHRKGLTLDGSHPGLLMGYGGFNISLTPYFSLVNVVWMEAGGVFAVANMRGGGEFGEAWHKAGMLEKKQNVFDDYHACAEHLAEAGYTAPDRLCLIGGSNGGLLVSAALVQRPDLCRAVVCSVPVIDMLRYHRFLIARYWMGEYGDPEDPAHFPFLYAYSPYHRVEDGADYPAVFFRTAEADSRVDPMHAMKMAARVQEATGSDKPILFWLNRKAGHGMGMPKDMIARETADELAFLFWQLRMQAPEEWGPT